MRRRKIWLRVTYALLLGAGAGLLIPSAALADTWSDLSDSARLSLYGVNASDVDGVADGYQDRTFRPCALVS
jgi:hypothetical protein